MARICQPDQWKKRMKTINPSKLISALILIALIGVGCTPLGTPTPAQPAVALQDCQLSGVGMSYSISARCGTLQVYEDQQQEAGRQIGVSFAVIPAVSKTAQTDALFLLAGGPGQAATETYPQLIPILDRLHQKRDIVLVDQRGTGGSNPLRCPALAATDETTSVEQAAPALKDCLNQLNADTRLYTTAAFVEDLEQVRQALRYQTMDLVGISYGTRVALAYMRQYPQFTRTVTLDSVNPLDWELGPQNPANAQRALDLVFQRCAADPACQAAFPNNRVDFQSLMATLQRQPAEVSLPHPTTGERIQVKLTASQAATTFQLLLYSPEMTAMIPLLVHETVARGDFSLLAAQYLISTGDLEKSIFDGLYLSVLCAEDVPFYPTQPAQVAAFLPDHTAEIIQQCQLWPHAQVSSEYKLPVQSNIPTLLLSGEADPVTPPANAERVAQGLSNGLNLVIPGLGHNVIYRGCVPKILTSFVDAGTVSGLDTNCVKDIRPSPFLLNYSGSQP
jgi:pimeloyl-ACP methyl ester carboxylesterase